MKDIPGWEGLYAVTEDGRVWSHPRLLIGKNHVYREWQGSFLRGAFNSGGYVTVALAREGNTTTRMVHRLVAETFIPNPLALPQVNHKNGIKRDNRVENLEWVTLQQNMIHAAELGLKPRGVKHHRARLTVKKVVAIRKLARRGASLAAIARDFGVAPSTIKHVVYRQTWKHVSG